MLKPAQLSAMKFFKLALTSAAMLLALCASLATADEADLPTWEHVSDTGFAGSASVSPRLWIETGDEPATAWYEYGGSSAYGKVTEKTTIPAHTAQYYTASLAADYAGGWVYYKFHLETPTKVDPGYADSSPTRGPPAINLVPPSVEGKPYPGQTLTCNPGVWNLPEGPSYASTGFAWNGFTGDVFEQNVVVNADDVGKKVSCTVSRYVSRVGGETVESASVTIVPAPPTPVVTASAAKSCAAPKLIGLSLKTARARVSAANCFVGSITHAWSSTKKKGRIIRSSQKPNGAIALVVSKGKKRAKR